MTDDKITPNVDRLLSKRAGIDVPTLKEGQRLAEFATRNPYLGPNFVAKMEDEVRAANLDDTGGCYR